MQQACRPCLCLRPFMCLPRAGIFLRHCCRFVYGFCFAVCFTVLLLVRAPLHDFLVRRPGLFNALCCTGNQMCVPFSASALKLIWIPQGRPSHLYSLLYIFWSHLESKAEYLNRACSRGIPEHLLLSSS